MATKISTGRQSSLFAVQDFDNTDLTSGAASGVTVEIPPNAIVVGGGVIVTTAFDAVTSDVLDVGDATTANRYLNDVNLKAVGFTALVPTGLLVTEGGKVTMTRTATGAATAVGAGRLVVEYVVKDRTTEVQ